MTTPLSNTVDGARSGREVSTPRTRALAYIRGRHRYFPLRQILTLAGAAADGIFVSPEVGLVAGAIGLAGEAVDLAALRLAGMRLRENDLGRGLTWLMTLSAGFQAFTIVGSIVLTTIELSLHDIDPYEARSFASAFLVAAIFNAGVARPFFRPAADARLAIYGLFSATLLAWDLEKLGRADRVDYLLFIFGFLVLVFMAAMFIAHVEQFHKQRRRHDEEIAAFGEENRRLALVAKYGNDSVIFTDSDGRITWVNDAFSRITGYSYEEAIGALPADLLNVPETEALAVTILEEARSRGDTVRLEVLNRTASGGRVWMETSLTPIFNADGSPKLSIAVERDITEAKAREAELARARQAAEAAAQAKQRFLANMSHEIRTPMNGVLGVAELLSETPLTEEQREYVETIADSGKALLEIINDVLDFAKLQSGKMVLESLPLSLADCIAGVVRILRPIAAKKGLSLVFEIPEEPMPMVLGDAGKIRQILMNLAGNAVKFTERGQVTLRLSHPADGLVEIAVADSGIGIAPDRLAQIFESFTQAETAISRQFGGTGLGLTISSMLARRMGGEITVTSSPGAGSVFMLRVRLPPARMPAEPLPKMDIDDDSLPSGLRLLIVEDNRTNMMILRKMLAGAGVTPIEAANGAEAVAAVRQSDPDLVLMDISMPVMDGFEATRLIRAEDAQHNLPRRPILALTANAFGEDRAIGRDAGIDDFLIKPLARQALFAAIRSHARTLAVRISTAEPERAARQGL